ncbi:MAG: hypothetical protein ACRD23_20945 [Terriglobales bacterium]
MNHHADKLVHASELREPGVEESLEGFVEEFHACPKCGSAASRHAVA